MFRNKENGYTPFNKANVIISVIVFIGLALGGLGMVAAIDDGGIAALKSTFTSGGYFAYTGWLFVAGVLGFALLIKRNMQTGSLVKSIIFTILGVALSVVVAAIVILLGMLFGSTGTTNRPVSNSDSTGYSYDQNNEARNKGYSNALEAERSGRKWNGSTWE